MAHVLARLFQIEHARRYGIGGRNGFRGNVHGGPLGGMEGRVTLCENAGGLSIGVPFSYARIAASVLKSGKDLRAGGRCRGTKGISGALCTGTDHPQPKR
jgi:hypothetical protein